MNYVLVQGAVIECVHQGRLRIEVGDPRVTVQGKGVILGGAETGLTFGSPTAPVPGMIAPCPAATPTTPPVSQPCKTAPTTPVGLARKLTVGGKPALLATAAGVTASGQGPGTWKVADPGQNVLETL
ncbi:hypothetical protein [Streptomyces sp. NPDC058667]|uniref:hypothetical protein n=1 Tax=Streptomyces sp. NPDC058667 TaxID=3346588 RepID=UPI00364EEC0B